uniref:Uncharacterized protein n=1 Tax=Anguilla anguilla TaxID=7936 RepID=A0A0E9TXQ4_ANGAN
MCVVMLLKQ